MTKETIEKVVKYKDEIDSLEKFLEVPSLHIGFTLLADDREHFAGGVLAKRIIAVVKQYKKELEKELKDM